MTTPTQYHGPYLSPLDDPNLCAALNQAYDRYRGKPRKRPKAGWHRIARGCSRHWWVREKVEYATGGVWTPETWRESFGALPDLQRGAVMGYEANDREIPSGRDAIRRYSEYFVDHQRFLKMYGKNGGQE